MAKLTQFDRIQQHAKDRRVWLKELHTQLKHFKSQRGTGVASLDAEIKRNFGPWL